MIRDKIGAPPVARVASLHDITARAVAYRRLETPEKDNAGITAIFSAASDALVSVWYHS
jgi:hypothetical protein